MTSRLQGTRSPLSDRAALMVNVSLHAPRAERGPCRRVRGLLASLVLLLLPLPALAALPPSLTYQDGEQTFVLEPAKYSAWRKTVEHATFRGFPIHLPPPGERKTPLPPGIDVRTEEVWDVRAIATTIEAVIGARVNRSARSVRIMRGSGGVITFEGVGLPGRRVNALATAHLTITALTEGIRTIQLPMEEEAPTVVVEDPELVRLGIREVVTVGESDFTGSPPNRRHNIAVGLERFRGHLIPHDAEFSFNAVLGPVDASTGYRNELTIRGDRTTPEYGGGLCQVSTTAFRGMWHAGFPITERQNHSFAVHFYSPEGTDATVYPPWKDFRFRNDSPGALLIQTLAEDDHAYFIYYGTKPEGRTAELVGPFTWDIKPPPPDRIGFTMEIPPGEKRILSQPIPGMKTLWYRIIREQDAEHAPELFYSHYETRPYFEEIGVVADDPRLLTGSGVGMSTEAATDSNGNGTDLSGEDR